MADDDLTMESTTDSAEQIADGLGVTLDVSEAVNDAIDGVESEPVVEGTEETTAEAEPVAEVTEMPAKVAAPRAPRSQKKSVDGAAAAARREADAKRMVLETENKALKERLAELAAGKLPTPVAQPVAPIVVQPVTIAASAIPDAHPEVAAVLAQRDALGPKPKQADFADFEDFEDKRDTWIEKRATLSARAESVREDVARRVSIEQGEANRAAAETAQSFQGTIAAAKARHADYDQTVQKATDDGLTLPRDVAQALMESPIGAEVMYYLAANPSEVHRINALPTANRKIAEIGILEGRVAAGLRAAPTPAAAGRTPVRTTKAPDPQNVVLGDFSSAGKKKDINDPNLTLAEYNQIRNEMDVASGRRQAR